MAYNPNYDKRLDAGSSGGGVTDLTAEKAYDVDVRRLSGTDEETLKAADTRNVGKQNRVEKFLRAARSAGKYQQKREIDAPWTSREGQTPAFLEGDNFGRAGSTNYSDKRSRLPPSTTDFSRGYGRNSSGFS